MACELLLSNLFSATAISKLVNLYILIFIAIFVVDDLNISHHLCVITDEIPFEFGVDF